MTLPELVDRYEIFFVDQYGVLHDGTAPYPGATEALASLTAARKTVVILSNSGKSAAANAARLNRIGIPEIAYTHLVTSGDVAVDHLTTRWKDLELPNTPRCFTISSDGDTNLADRLGLPAIEDPATCDLVVIAGSQADRIGLESYRTMLLAPAARRRVPAICTNPDIEMITPQGLAPAAGAIANLYEDLGGVVIRIGKPFEPIYDYAYKLCGEPAKSRILAIGDSVEHDAAGANGFGIDAAIVRQGVSANASESEIRNAADRAGITIAFLLNSLCY